MKKYIITVIVITLIQFVFNAVSWMALPFHNAQYQNLPDGLMNSDAWNEQLPASGIYHYPGLPTADLTLSEIEQRLADGPRISYMVVQKGSTEIFPMTSFLLNLLCNILTAIGIIWLVGRFRDHSFGGIAKSLSTVGLLALLLIQFPFNNWHMVPWTSSLLSAFDVLIVLNIIAFFLAKYTFRNASSNS